MKKIVLCLLSLLSISLTGCKSASYKPTKEQETLFRHDVKMLYDRKESLSTSAELFFNVSLNVLSTSEKFKYNISISEPTEDFEDIKLIILPSVATEKEIEKKIFPCVGYFDNTKINLVKEKQDNTDENTYYTKLSFGITSASENVEFYMLFYVGTGEEVKAFLKLGGQK